MVAEASRPQPAEEVADLVGGDRVASPHVHAAPLLERCPAIDPDQPPVGVEQPATGVTRIDGRIDLQAVGILQDRAGGILVAVHPGDDARADRRPQIGGQKKRIAGGEAEVAHLNIVAVGELGAGKIIAAE